MFVDGQFQGFDNGGSLSSALMGSGFGPEFQNVLPEPSSPLQFEMPVGGPGPDYAATGKGAGQLFSFLKDSGAFGGGGDPVVDAPSQVGSQYQESASPTFGEGSGGTSAAPTGAETAGTGSTGAFLGGGGALLPIGMEVNKAVYGPDANKFTAKNLKTNFIHTKIADLITGGPVEGGSGSFGLHADTGLMGMLSGGMGSFGAFGGLG